MSFKGSNPFGKKWPLGPSVIDYIANRLCISQADACLVLQKKMREGEIGAQGPIKSANADLIDKGFWNFARIDADGNVFKQLHWFEVSAEDVLSVWPPEGEGGGP
jgi:hypothetical protein